MEGKYIKTAIRELQHPTLEITKQHLEVIDIQSKNGEPETARTNFKNDIVSVYFKVRDERFFFVINITKSEQPEPTYTWIESGHHVYLTATSEHLDFQALQNSLNLSPLTGWSKGQLRANGRSKHSFSRVSFEPNENEAYSLEEKLSELLSELEKDEKGVAQLAENALAYISVCRHQYVCGNTGIHLNVETINRLQKLGLALDISTYIVGENLLS